MADAEKIDQRLSKLEDRIKDNFLDIEKKFQKIEGFLGERETGDVEIVEGKEKITNMKELTDRIQELEDLLLLIEMENTKIKEKIVGSANIETPVDVLTRIQKLEEKVAVTREITTEGLEKKIGEIDEYISKEMAEFDKRLARIEDSASHEMPRTVKMMVEKQPEGYKRSNLLEEVQKILEE